MSAQQQYKVSQLENTAVRSETLLPGDMIAYDLSSALVVSTHFSGVTNLPVTGKIDYIDVYLLHENTITTARFFTGLMAFLLSRLDSNHY